MIDDPDDVIGTRLFQMMCVIVCVLPFAIVLILPMSWAMIGLLLLVLLIISL